MITNGIYIFRFLDPSERGLSELIDPNPWMEKHTKLMKKIAKIVDDYGFVHFMPLNITDETSITEALTFVSFMLLNIVGYLFYIVIDLGLWLMTRLHLIDTTFNWKYVLNYLKGHLHMTAYFLSPNKILKYGKTLLI